MGDDAQDPTKGDPSVGDSAGVQPEAEAPRGMYPGKLDDRGRVKLPSTFQQYFAGMPEKTLFVTSLDRRIAQIYPMQVWRNNEKVFAGYKKNPAVAKSVAFNAADLGAETEMDSQGRVLFSPELRRELGIENSAVRLFFYNGRIDVMSEKIYEQRKAMAAQLKEEDFNDLEAEGMK